jgi:CHAT domain-containing protein
VQRTLAPGETHRYEVALASGEFASVVVEQRGIDVGIQARDEGGQVIAIVSDEPGTKGDERVDLVTKASAVITVVVAPVPGVVGPGDYAIRIEGRHPATDGDWASQEVRALRTKALAARGAGRERDARGFYQQALTLTANLPSRDDRLIAILNFELAGSALELRDETSAAAAYQRAIDLFNRTVGADHPYSAMARSRLALLYEQAGQGPKAEALLLQALGVLEKTLGTRHLWYVQSLTTLGNIRYDAGDLDKAEEIDRRAEAILEAMDCTGTIQYGGLLNNLGEIYRQRQEFDRAADLFERSLAIARRIEGEDSYRVSIAYQNLGIIARERKQYAEAADDDLRGLAIRERLLGPDHPDIAPLLNNLAIVQHLTGDDARALETNFRTLDLWLKTRGPYHRGTLLSVGNIARLYAATGDIPNAIAFQRRADGIVEEQLTLNLAVGSERQKLAFVNGIASERTDRTISLHLDEAPTNPDAGALAMLVLLQRKGRVLDAMTDTFASVRQRVADRGDQKLIDQLKATTRELAQAALSDPNAGNSGEASRRIAELEAEKERIEGELSAHSAELRAQLCPVTVDSVQAALPDDAALVEFAVFRPFDPRAERNAEAYQPPHYAAYVLRRHAAPVGRDLGPAAAVDRLIEAFREALRDPRRTDVKDRARALDEVVMRSLRGSLGSATRLLVSPDGPLTLVPFEALVDEQGRYLVERYAMTYLTSGRDLLRMQVARASLSDPVIVADPRFGEPLAAVGTGNRSSPTGAARRSAPPAAGFSEIYFPPLAATAAEARAIKRLFPESTVLTGTQATKAALEHLEAPRMLHIASHGFFLPDAPGGASTAVAGTRGISGRARVENPLLRSGIALAGANRSQDPEDDGILTALEASGLNLWGTKLVTLSACETGVGDVRNGEGVYGLRRAFMLAGAETLVTSLWPVSDYVGRDEMTAYYSALKAGAGRGDGLRQMKLAMLGRKERRHPFYWAGFIQSGEWGNLDGQR